MDPIVIPVMAYKLSLRLTPAFRQKRPLFPKLLNTKLVLDIPNLANAGNVVPSTWTRQEIEAAFKEANRIWQHFANIEFKVLDILDLELRVSEDPEQMFRDLMADLPRKQVKVPCAFVHDLEEEEGGWGTYWPGGGFTVVSHVAAKSAFATYGGLLLAHELGHVLTDDPGHKLADGMIYNLMYRMMKPDQAKPRTLNQPQIDLARKNAAAIG